MIGANATIDIYHQNIDNDNSSYPNSPNITNVDAFIESRNSDIEAALDRSYQNRVFNCFVDPIDISEGDKVDVTYQSSSSVDFNAKVAGVEKHVGNLDSQNEYRVTIKKQVEQK